MSKNKIISIERQSEQWFLQIKTANIFLLKSTTIRFMGCRDDTKFYLFTRQNIPSTINVFSSFSVSSKNALPDAIAEFPSALSFRYLREITNFSSKRNTVRCNRKSLATVQVGRRKTSLIFRYSPGARIEID